MHVTGSRTSNTNRLWNSPAEITIHYDPRQHDLYRRGKRACVFYKERWPLCEGRGRFGEFPLVVARAHYRRLGYSVLASEPRLPHKEGFILVAYPGKRRAGDPAYQRMEAIFGSAILEDLNVRADNAKRQQTGNSSGGDPDLFVYRNDDPEDRFFVEVKHHDHLTRKQRITFPLIGELCPIVVVRLVAEHPVP